MLYIIEVGRARHEEYAVVNCDNAMEAGEETEKLEKEYGGDTEEYWTQEAYESGIYEAYALCKRVFED